MLGALPSFIIHTPYRIIPKGLHAPLYPYHLKKALPTIQPRSAGWNQVPSLSTSLIVPTPPTPAKLCVQCLGIPSSPGLWKSGRRRQPQECKSGVTPNLESNLRTPTPSTFVRQTDPNGSNRSEQVIGHLSWDKYSGL